MCMHLFVWLNMILRQPIPFAGVACLHCHPLRQHLDWPSKCRLIPRVTTVFPWPPALQVLQCTKQLRMWGTNDEADATYYDLIAKDPDIVKVVLLLTGSIEGVKLSTTEYLSELPRVLSAF